MSDYIVIAIKSFHKVALCSKEHAATSAKLAMAVEIEFGELWVSGYNNPGAGCFGSGFGVWMLSE